MLEYRNESGAKRRVSLGRADFDRGKEAADALAAELRSTDRVPQADLTLKTLLDAYEREVTPRKGLSGQAHDRRARKLFEQCWGQQAKVTTLDTRDWDRFIAQRRSGALAPSGNLRKAKGVRDRAIEQDLKFILAVCNWAEVVRTGGNPMLAKNPFRGFSLPVEMSPNRPSLAEEEFEKMLAAAAFVGRTVPLFLILAHESGHRCSAVGHLRWSDIDLSNAEQPFITWRKEHDKIGLEHRVPISGEAAKALADERKRTGRIGDGWVFPSPVSDSEPIPRDILREWWLRLERAAGIPHVKGRGWHSLRRKFATELKTMPLADLCYMGGWKEPQTVLKCYMKPDDITMRDALTQRAQRRAAIR